MRIFYAHWIPTLMTLRLASASLPSVLSFLRLTHTESLEGQHDFRTAEQYPGVENMMQVSVESTGLVQIYSQNMAISPPRGFELEFLAQAERIYDLLRSAL